MISRNLVTPQMGAPHIGRWLGAPRVALLGLLALAGCSSSNKAKNLSEDAAVHHNDGGPAHGGSAGEAPDAQQPLIEAGPRMPDAALPIEAGPGGSSSDSGTPDSGMTLDAGQDAGCSVEPGAGTISPPTGVSGAQCFGVNWAPGSALGSANTPQQDRLGSITPDELAMAWMADGADGGGPVIYYTSRHYPTFPFDPPRTIPAGAYAEAGIALSADGLRLVVVLADHRSFSEYSRATPDDPFSDPPSDTQFVMLNSQISQYLSPGTLCDDPVLSADDLTLYFSVYGGNNTSGNYDNYRSAYTIYSSTRIPYVTWPAGTPLMGSMLESQCDLRRRPTGISNDQLTLFYWDDVSGTARAAFRPALDQPFNGAVDLGERPNVQPNSDCTQLYYSGADGDIWSTRISD